MDGSQSGEHHLSSALRSGSRTRKGRHSSCLCGAALGANRFFFWRVRGAEIEGGPVAAFRPRGSRLLEGVPPVRDARTASLETARATRRTRPIGRRSDQLTLCDTVSVLCSSGHMMGLQLLYSQNLCMGACVCVCVDPLQRRRGLVDSVERRPPASRTQPRRPLRMSDSGGSVATRAEVENLILAVLFR